MSKSCGINSVIVFLKPPGYVVGHAGIVKSVSAFKDVDKIVVFAHTSTGSVGHCKRKLLNACWN